MSLSGAISSAVAALQAQAQSIAMISDNIANSETSGYKTTYASFSSLVTGESSASYSSGGVLVSSRSNVSQSGLLTSTNSATDMAIDGSGFFPVTSEDGSSVYYTRNGAFEFDEEGHLTNNGYYLLGWPTDADGNVTAGSSAGSLEMIDVDSVSSSAAATSDVSIVANLPANAEVGDTFTNTLDLYDSLGTASTSTITWTKTAENSWTASFSNPVSASDGTTEVGTVSSSSITISFNADGTLASTSPSPPTLSVTGWSTGAADSSISLDLGDAGKANGLSQYSSTAETLKVTATIDQDGLAYGTLSSIAVGDDGTVEATYTNGQTRAIYKIPVATFANADGLTAMSGAVYAASGDSGSATYHIAGADGAGTIEGSTLESSTTDTNEEFANMIAAQQAYSAAARVMSTASNMYDSLLQAVS